MIDTTSKKKQSRNSSLKADDKEKLLSNFEKRLN